MSAMVSTTYDDTDYEKILDKMGPMCAVYSSPMVCRVNGEHTCCPTHTHSWVFQNRVVTKSPDGKFAFIRCLKVDESEDIANSINLVHEKRGFHAKPDNLTIELEMPWHSTSSLIHESGCQPLWCIHENGFEEVIYALYKKEDYQKSKTLLENADERFFSEYAEHSKFPISFGVVAKNVSLPMDASLFDGRLVKFLVEEKFTINQARTIISLYQLIVRAQRDIYEMPKNAVIEIVCKHSGNKEKTVCKQIFTGKKGSLEQRLINDCLGKMLDDISDSFL